jgi:two-component sensor histidine kinase
MRRLIRMTDALRFVLVAILLLSMSISGAVLIRIVTSALRESVAIGNRILCDSLAHELELLADGSRNAIALVGRLEATGGEALETARKALPSFDSLALLDLGGRVVQQSKDAELLGYDLSGRSFFVEPHRTGLPYLSDSFLSLHTGQPTAAIAVPVKGGVAVGFLNLDSLASYIAVLSKGSDEIIAVADSAGVLVAHTDPAKVKGRERLDAVEGSLDGRQVVMSRAKVVGTGWTVLVARPLARLLEPAERATRILVVAVVVTALFSLLALSLVLDRSARDIDALVLHSHAIAAGDYGRAIAGSAFREFDELARDFRAMAAAVGHREGALRAAEARTMESLKEKDILLREVHHRVKNNLQLVISLLALEKGTGPESAESGFEDSMNRVRSMAMIHEMLYESGDIAEIDMAEYIRALAESLAVAGDSQGRVPQLELELESLGLDIDRAIPCGLIVNEVVTNALKYAHDDSDRGPLIRISGKRAEDGMVELVVRDDGPGIPRDVDPETCETLGLRLITSLARQLKGVYELRRSPGTTWIIRFPAP